MGLYLPGMTLPKEGERALWLVVHHEGIVEYEKDGWRTARNAIPVPDHGDLIDRDKAVQDLRMDYAYAAAKIVALQPTIINADKEATE